MSGNVNVVVVLIDQKNNKLAGQFVVCIDGLAIRKLWDLKNEMSLSQLNHLTFKGIFQHCGKYVLLSPFFICFQELSL